MRVLVAGAGIGGLTAALSLHAAGIDAIVIESARELRPLGVGINLLPPQYSVHRGQLQMLLLSAVHDRLGAPAVTSSPKRDLE